MATSLAVDPVDLTFEPPYDRQITKLLNLRNDSDASVAFKVKTTAPKRYCVRPNAGIVSPKETKIVQVILQAKAGIKEGTKSKDKFLVQCAEVPAGQTIDKVSDFLASLSDDQIVNQKIKSHFTGSSGGSSSTKATPTKSVETVSATDSTSAQAAPSGSGASSSGAADSAELAAVQLKLRKANETLDSLTAEKAQYRRQVNELTESLRKARQELSQAKRTSVAKSGGYSLITVLILVIIAAGLAAYFV